MKLSDLPPAARARLCGPMAPNTPSLAKSPCVTSRNTISSVITLDGLRLHNPTNRSEHWSRRAERARRHRSAVFLALRAHMLPCLPATVTVRRYGPHVLDDDGLVSSAKACRDGVMDAYSVDDGSPLFAWVYEQEQAKKWGVRIIVERREAAK